MRINRFDESFDPDYIQIGDFEMYVPLKEYNIDWEDPKGYFKKGRLPVAYSKEYIMKKINEI